MRRSRAVPPADAAGGRPAPHNPWHRTPARNGAGPAEPMHEDEGPSPQRIWWRRPRRRPGRSLPGRPSTARGGRIVADWNETNRPVIDEFHANGGVVDEA